MIPQNTASPNTITRSFKPASLENLNFLHSTIEIFTIFKRYSKWRLNDYEYQIEEGHLLYSEEIYLSTLYAIALSGGSLVKTYPDPNMDKRSYSQMLCMEKFH